MTTFDKIAYGLSVVAVIGLLCFIVFSRKGFLEYQALKSQQSRILEQIEIEKQKRKKLEHEIISLKTDMEYIRHVAKHEHDMAEEGELVIKDTSSETALKNTKEQP